MLATVVEGDPKAPFSIATTPIHQYVGEGPTPFPGLPYFTFDPHFTLIKYHFLCLWYDSIRNWAKVSEAIYRKL